MSDRWRFWSTGLGVVTATSTMQTQDVPAVCCTGLICILND